MQDKQKVTALSSEVLAAVRGYRQLIAIGFPVGLSMSLQKSLQAVRMAAKPIDAERERIAMKFAAKSNGKVVYEGIDRVKIDPKRYAEFNAEMEKWDQTRHTVAVEPLRRSDVPSEVDGKPLIIAGEVFDLLGPFLVD